MKYKLVICIGILFCVTILGCLENFLSSGGDNIKNYPTILYPLPEEKVTKLQQEFDSLNHFAISSQLNKYGLTGDRSYQRAYNMVKLSADSALQLAIKTLLINSKFTNVIDRASLLNNGYNITDIHDGTRWKIVFGPQKYNGFEIPFSWIHIWIYGNEPYAIEGHWYKDIFIPSRFVITKENAQKRVVGEEIIWYDFAGKPVEFIVTEESVGNSISTVIFPLEKENTIELRVCWKIPIMFFGDDIPGWHIYIDVMNGEKVSVIQEFMT